MPSAALVTSQINLKLIQTFLTVAEMKSFRGAADQVKRSQSAVSMQIKQLEEQLGVALFHRTTRSVKLTAEGEKLVGSAQRAIGEMENGIRDLLEAADSRRDHVTIACSPTIAPRQLPPILTRFAADYPRVNIILRELKSQDLFESIRRGDADFGIGPVITDGDFEFSTVLSDRVCALMSNDYLPGRKDSVSLAELAQVPIIQYHEHTVLGSIVDEAARAHGVELNARYRCIQAETIVAMAEASLGVAIVIGSVARSTRSPKLRQLLITKPALVQHFAIVTRKGQMLSPAAERLSRLIRAHLPFPNGRKKVAAF